LRKVVDTHNGSDLVCTSYENQWPRKNWISEQFPLSGEHKHSIHNTT
jgi:hypothetical protein